MATPLDNEGGEGDGGHRLDDYGGAEGKAHVMTAGDAALGYAGGGFEGDAEHQRVAVGDAAVDAAGVVGERDEGFAVAPAAAAFVVAFAMAPAIMLIAAVAALVVWLVVVAFAMAPALVTFATVAALVVRLVVVTFAAVLALVLRVGVVVLRTLHGCGSKTVAELDAAYSRDGKHRVGDAGFDAVPERLAYAYGQTLDRTGHDSAKGISLRGGLFQGLRPFRRIRQPSDLSERCVERGEIEHLLGNYPGCDHGKSHPPGEMAPATRVVETSGLDPGRIIGMAGTGILGKSGIVAAPGILIPEHYGQGRSGGMAIIDAADDFRAVGLDSWRGSFCATFAPQDILVEIFQREGNPRDHSVYGHTDNVSVGLSEDRHPEIPAVSVHPPINS